MAITQDPDILFIFNESSGTTVPNLNTSNGDGSITSDNSTSPNYTWNQDAGSYDGYLSLDEPEETHVTFTSVATFASTLTDESLAMGFNLTAYDSGYGTSWLFANGGNPVSGAISVVAVAPTSTGDFNVRVEWRIAEGNISGDEYTFEDLSYSTDYLLAVGVDRSTPSAVQVTLKLNAETNVTPSTISQSSFTLETAGGGYIGRESSFDHVGNFIGDIYYYAYWRGYDITADVANVNSDPAGTIPLWPASGGSALPLLNAYYHGL